MLEHFSSFYLEENRWLFKKHWKLLYCWFYPNLIMNKGWLSHFLSPSYDLWMPWAILSCNSYFNNLSHEIYIIPNLEEGGIIKEMASHCPPLPQLVMGGWVHECGYRWCLNKPSVLYVSLLDQVESWRWAWSNKLLECARHNIFFERVYYRHHYWNLLDFVNHKGCVWIVNYSGIVAWYSHPLVATHWTRETILCIDHLKRLTY